ncbi:hypothetical protein D9758_003759 [Tetrapyrgos nigripes]|uniref:Uncharacterized protein n=1 Tax=Tetrapyrgos nigripes TaxID=182062 RepID=A0A8H5GLT0_9AGAR|nr:hypothetical protein D9758_003759 [Tetrapyrgos nigripes]
MSQNTSAVTIVLDDTDFDVDGTNCFILNGTSGVETLRDAFNGTLVVSKTGCFISHHLDEGTRLDFYGYTPPLDTSQTFNFSEGGSAVRFFPPITFYGPNIGGLWFTTLGVSESSIFSIDLQFNGPLLVFDYALLTVAEFTELRNQTILVDDENVEEIQWQGKWQERKNYTLFFDAQLPTTNSSSFSTSRAVPSRPHGNGTHDSNTAGDSFIFQFQGTSILVAGVSPYDHSIESESEHDLDLDPAQSAFHISLNFTLDGNSTEVIITNGNLDNPGTPHFPYFRADSLTEGNHTLYMTVNDVSGNTSVVIDYLTYRASFDTLLDKPVFPTIAASPSPSPSPTPSSTPSPTPNSNTLNKGAIAGGTVGGIVLLALLVVPPPNTRAMSNLEIEPFLLPSPVENPSSRKGVVSPSTGSQPAATSLTTKSQQESNQHHSSQNLTSSASEQHSELRRQRDELTETVENLESERANSPSQNFATQEQIGQMQARIDMLTREMSRYMAPPAYD